MSMNIDSLRSELGVMQLSDSFFPTGLYTTSNGLEVLFYGKKIKGAEEIRDLIKVFIIQQLGPADCVALGNAYDFAKESNLPKVIEVDQLVHSMRLIQEIRDASARSGSQLLRCISSFVKNKILDGYNEAINKGEAFGVHPVALAVASNALGVSKEKAGLMLLYGFSVSVVGAALRLGMIHHFESQRIIHELKSTISDSVEKYQSKPLSDMWQFAPEVDIIQISHEKMFSKMFIT